MIRAEIDGNNRKAQELANEQGMKVAQNVAAGVVGLVIWPVWFGMDLKGAAGQDAANFQARQEYLTQLAGDAGRLDRLPGPARARLAWGAPDAGVPYRPNPSASYFAPIL